MNIHSIYTKRAIFKDTIWALSGNYAYALSQWGLLIVLVRFTDTKTLGQFSIGIAVCAPIIMFFNMRLRLVLASDTQNNYSFATFLHTRLLTAFSSILLITLYSLAGPFDRHTAIIIMLIGIAKSIESISDIFFGLFQKTGFINKMCISLIIKAITSLLLFSLTIIYSKNLIYACVALFLSWLFLLIFFDLPSAKIVLKSSNSYKEESLNEVTKYENSFINWEVARLIRNSFILGAVALVGSLLVNVPRYFIDYTLGSEDLGIYVAISYIGIATLLGATSLIQPLMPKIAYAYKSGDLITFKKIYLKTMCIATALGIFGIIVSIYMGELILVTLYGYEYLTYANLFIAIMVAISFSYFVLYQWYILTALEQFKSQLLLSSASLIVLLLLCIFIFQYHSLINYAIAEAIALAIHVIIGTLIIRKAYSSNDALNN